ncbi:hypothetical protein UFOVP607_27 [uncultured Caudovirales phage]|uniref:Uncharacterized protein n=1 Tax=uncultured Caudovirales phage TaxID=2100421 RepID=A0A6J5NAS7_9CAUD|nr:hypothetical protein UFOVP607_27 [uncultured Caudovirales phage]
MSNTLKPTCCAKIFGSRAFNPSTCGKTAKVEREGNHYCGIHDPVARQAKDDARHEKYKQEQSRIEAERKKNRDAQAELVRRAGCFDELLACLKHSHELIVLVLDGKELGNIRDYIGDNISVIAKAEGGAA